MLDNFFRINLPYGFARNENGEWMAFNREYMPLGYNENGKKGMPGESYSELPVYTKYNRITEDFLVGLADDKNAIHRNDKGEIVKVFLYDDGSNPVNQSSDKPALWNNYFSKLKKLSGLKIKKDVNRFAISR